MSGMMPNHDTGDANPNPGYPDASRYNPVRAWHQPAERKLTPGIDPALKSVSEVKIN